MPPGTRLVLPVCGPTLVCLLAALSASPAGGQTPGPARDAVLPRPSAAQHGPGADPLCFRGRTIDRCGSFLLLESGIAYGLPHSSRRPPANLVWEAGWMRNASPRSAYGGTLVGHFDEDERVFLGAKFRYRRWLSDTFALDLAPGFVIQASDRDALPAGPGFVGHAGLSAGDWGAVVLQFELMNLPEEDRVTNPGTVFLGLRAGSYPALAVGSFLAWFADFVTRFD